MIAKKSAEVSKNLIYPSMLKDWTSPKRVMTNLVAIVVLAVIVIVIISSIVSAASGKASIPAQAPVKTTSAPKTDTSSQSADQLKSESLVTLNAETKVITDLHAKILIDASQPNAAAANSDLHNDIDTFNTSPDMTVIAAYNKVSNQYYAANIVQPTSLDSWSTDIQKVYDDIFAYARDSWSVSVDNLLGSDNSTDSRKLAADVTAYSTDLAATNADIAAF